jgi:Carboxypeptidase regulatory-like domain
LRLKSVVISRRILLALIMLVLAIGLASLAEKPRSQPAITSVRQGEGLESVRSDLIESPDAVDAERSAITTSVSAPDTGCIITGRVIDDIGQLVQGPVLISATPSLQRHEEAPRLKARRPKLPAMVRSIATDGYFELPITSGVPWEVFATSGNRRPSTVVRTECELKARSITIVVPRSATLTGRVVDIAGAPIAAATILLDASAVRSKEADITSGNYCSIDANDQGYFRIDGVEPGVVSYAAHHVEFAESPWRRAVAYPGETRHVVIRLEKGGRIEGDVGTHAGSIYPREIRLYSAVGVFGWREAETDKRGHFVIDHVPPQEYTIELASGGASRHPESPLEEEQSAQASSTGIRKLVEVLAGRTTFVSFDPAPEMFQVRGQVLSNGLPVKEARILVRPVAGELTNQETSVDANGRFAVQLLAPGERLFGIKIGSKLPVWQAREVTASAETFIVLELPTASISGIVLDGNGTPLDGIALSLVDEGGYGPLEYRIRFSRSADGGRFQFDGLQQGNYVLRAPHMSSEQLTRTARSQFGRIARAVAVSYDGERVVGLTVRLQAPGTLEGTVTSPNGDPIANALIRLKNDSGVWCGSYYDALADDEGRFVIGSLGPGVYSVYIGELNADPLDVISIQSEHHVIIGLSWNNK